MSNHLSSTKGLRTAPLFPKQLVLAVAGLFLCTSAFLQTAQAEPTTRTVKTTTITVTESAGDSADGAIVVLSPTPAAEAKEGEINEHFGSKATTGTTGCKTEALNKDIVKDLKADCKAWMKDRKGDLKNKFVTGSCDEQCTDCGMTLQRCGVKGSVRYSK